MYINKEELLVTVSVLERSTEGLWNGKGVNSFRGLLSKVPDLTKITRYPGMALYQNVSKGNGSVKIFTTETKIGTFSGIKL